ncbi:nucleotidyl transferase AbiEii/AbiGii toxin family protein [candidate division KSB1 bacterium]|nr:nucleotidyl transferase AbiEii/AbiGii toxin family protein [candidate division KSB1 bacterium]
MKDYLAELVRTSPTPAHSRNLVREYLQARILGALQRAAAMIPLAFHGGTALRFLFASARYSEDLDFALEKDKSRYDFRAYLQAIRSELAIEGYAVQLKINDKKTVHSAFVGFPGLLHELRLSGHRSEVLAVKIEVDTNPPAGAELTTSLVRRHITLQLQHHDRASLLAGKLHALLQRSHLKGRDLYDLLWYLSDPNWPAPNLTLLNNALQQTGWQGKPLAENDWRPQVRKRLEAIDWQRVVNDVRPFLEPSADPNLLTHENLRRVLGD